MLISYETARRIRTPFLKTQDKTNHNAGMAAKYAQYARNMQDGSGSGTNGNVAETGVKNKQGRNGLGNG